MIRNKLQIKFIKNSCKVLHVGLANGLKKSDDWFDLVAKTMIYNFELLYTNIYQPQNFASFVAYYLYNKLAKNS